MEHGVVTLIKSGVKNIFGWLARYRARPQLKKLHALNYPAAEKIASAISEALNHDLTPDELKWVERIEKVRSALSFSSMKISVTDYGAGKSHSNRTENEMYEGAVSTLTVSNVCKASKSPFWALVLFKIIRKFKPRTCIELGTCLGISAAYQAAAQKLNNNGHITTLEGAAVLASMSETNLRELGLDNAIVVNGRFQDNLERVLSDNKPIDYAFIDGHHDERATVSYFSTFIPYLARKSVIVFDDISWSSGMRRAWREIVVHQKIKIAVDLRSVGICVIDDDIQNKTVFRIPLI